MENITLLSLSIIPIVLVVPAQYIYLSNGKYSINYPGNEKWTLTLRRKINKIFLYMSLLILLISEVGIGISIGLNSFSVVSLNEALLIATTICLTVTTIGLLIFFLFLNNIIKSAQQDDAPESRI